VAGAVAGRSWSGNSGGVEYLDMATNFSPDQLTWWGQRIREYSAPTVPFDPSCPITVVRKAIRADQGFAM